MSPARSRIPADQILSAILTLAKRGASLERFAFRGHDFELQGIFNDLARSSNYPLLGAFVFSNNGPDPYSPILTESVSKLQLSGLIGRENPDYEVVFLRPAAEQFFDSELQKKFSQTEMTELKAIAGELLKRVEVVSSVA